MRGVFLLAQGQPPRIDNCPNQSAGSSSCLTNIPQVPADAEQLQNILSVIFGVIAAAAVVVLVMAAINFATAGSDTDKISRSKKTILYALIGLTIAVSAEIIVLTVVGSL